MQMESRIIREAEPHHQHRSSSYEIQPTFGHSSYRGYYRPSFILPFKDSQQQIASIATFKASNYNNSLQQRLFILTYTFTTYVSLKLSKLPAAAYYWTIILNEMFIVISNIQDDHYDHDDHF